MARKKSGNKSGVTAAEKKAKTPPATKKIRGRKKAASRRRRAPITAARVRELAINAETFAAAETAVKLPESLPDILSAHPRLQASWERGRFLRNLRELAATAVTIAEAEQALELPADRLRQLLETDKEIADTWNQARLATTIEIKAALVSAAKDGKANAIKNVERLLVREIARSSQDFTHITIAEMVELTGKTRQTIHEWYTRYGLMRNSDKTYNLRDFLTWFEQFTLSKATGRNPHVELDILKTRKAEKLEIDLAHRRGQLLDRDEVMAGILARHQSLLDAFNRKAEELAMTCTNQPVPTIIRILQDFFADVCSQQCRLPEQLRLPPEIAERFAAILEELKPEGE